MANITGTIGDDNLNGTQLADLIKGLDGDDTINGNEGNDTLDGGVGNDAYVFNLGSGQDTLVSSGLASDQDVIVLGEGIRPEDVVLRSNFRAENYADSDLAGQYTFIDELGWTLSIRGRSDTLQVNGAFDEATQTYAIKEIQFADGTVWDTDAIKSALQISTNGNDQLLGFNAEDNVISGSGGNDQIYGGSGNDVLDGGTGDDKILGQAGNDQVRGGAGNDLLYGGRGNDTVWGGSGNDRLYGDDGYDELYGGAGNDTLNYGEVMDGGAGNDYLRVGVSDGSHTFLFGRGDGRDSLESYAGPITGEKDRLVFKAGVRAEDVIVRNLGGTELEFTFKGSTQGERFKAWGGIGRVEFADGTVWKIDQASLKAQTADNGNNVLFGWGANEGKTLAGLGGNDTLFGSRSSQTLDGGTGNDSLYGGANADVLLGGDGTDLLSGGYGDDTLRGQNGNDNLYGEYGNDTLAGGSGNDYLSGSEGSDTYQFGLGSQSDTIVNADSTGAGVDKLLIGAGSSVTQAQVWLQRSGNDLKVALIGTGDNVTVKDWYGSNAVSSQLDALQIGNGKQLLAAQVDVLVNAMAAFSPPAAGQTTLPDNYQAVLNPLIAANWT